MTYVWLLLSLAQVAVGSSDGGWSEKFRLGPCQALSCGQVYVSVSPDAGRAVFLRRCEPRGQASWDDLIYADLDSGKEMAALRLGWSESPYVSLSADGNLVAILRQTGHLRAPFELSVWRPLSRETTPRVYDVLPVTGTGRTGNQQQVLPIGKTPAVPSPTGSAIAFLAWSNGRPESSLGREVIALLDPQSGAVRTLTLPLKREVEEVSLLWNDDGDTLYAALHGPHQDLTLYHATRTDKQMVELGPLPSRVHAPSEVRRVDRERRVLIVRPRSESAEYLPVAALHPGSWPSDSPAPQPLLSDFQDWLAGRIGDVYPGRTRIFGVRDGGDSDCVRVVEREHNGTN